MKPFSERDERIYYYHQLGLGTKAIGAKVGVSQGRVWQVLATRERLMARRARFVADEFSYFTELPLMLPQRVWALEDIARG